MPAKGEKCSPQTKAKISAAARKRYLESLDDTPEPLSKKPCSKCRQVKLLTEFYRRKKLLKAGVWTSYPDSWCKPCTIENQAKRWLRLKDEGVDVAAIKRRHYVNGDLERRREKHREWQAARRREEGKPVRGPRLFAGAPEKRESLAVEPISKLLERELVERDMETIEQATGISKRRIYGLIEREYERVSLRVVDKLLTGLGLTHELPVLYPQEH